MIRIISRKFANSRPSSSVASAAFIISAAGILSRILGLFRDRILASQFGAGDTLDVYYAAFRIPDLIYNLLILGALSAAFIPVFTSLVAKDDEKSAWKLANGLLSVSLLILVVLSGLLAVFTPYLMKIITPGYSGEKMDQVVSLTRIMFLSPLFLGISGIFGGILNSFKRFLIYSLAPIMYNFGIIIGALFFVPSLGVSGLAWGVVLGAMLHMLIQYPAVKISGFRYRFYADFWDSHLKKVIKLMIPRTMGLAVTQINLLIVTIISSTLAAGSLAIFNFANNLQSFPLGIFGIPFALAVFPNLSHAAAKKDFNSFVSDFSHAFRQILYFVIPATILLLVLRAQIVRVVLGSGKFDWEDTILTYQSLGIFALSLFAQSTVPLLARSFYALHNTRTPFYTGVISEIANLTLAITLTKYFGILGLVAAFSTASIVNMALLFFILHIKLKDLDDKKIIATTVKIGISALAAGITAQLSKYAVSPLIDFRTFIGIFCQMSFSALAGILVYILFSRLFKLEEFEAVKNFFSLRMLRKKRMIPEDPTEVGGI